MNENCRTTAAANAVLMRNSDESLFRILEVSPDEDLIIAVNLNDSTSLPFRMSFEEVCSGLNYARYLPVDYTEPLRTPLTSPSAKARFERIRPALSEILAHGYRELSERPVWPLIRQASEKFGIPGTTINRLLGRVMKAGGVLEAAAADYAKCGRKSSIAGKLRPTAQPGAYALSAVDLGNISKGVNLFLREEATWKKAYGQFLEKFYASRAIIHCGQRVIIPRSVGERPSFRQFCWHGKKLVPLKTRIRNQVGERVMATNHRGKPNGQTEYAIYPGQVTELDWTLSDIVAVSRGTRLSIGRLVIYVLIDVYSGIIQSLYLTIGNASYVEASRAILGCLEDKGELFKRFGMGFTQDHWPVKCLPAEIRCDKGEVDSWKAQGLVTFAGINLEFCASKRPDQKGTCESFFAVVRWYLRRMRGGTSGMKERIKDHPNVTAVYDFDQLYRVLLNLVIKFNARKRRRQSLSPGMVADGILPVPNQMWRWGLERGCVRDYALAKARLEILPCIRANITSEGIKIKGLHFRLPAIDGIDPEEWLMRARVKALPQFFSFDPATTNFVYLHCKHPTGDTEQLLCNLSEEDKGWADLSWQEYETMRRRRSEQIAEYEANEQRLLIATADADIQRVTAIAVEQTIEAREGLARKEIVHGTEERRIAETGGDNKRLPKPSILADDFINDDWKNARKAG